MSDYVNEARRWRVVILDYGKVSEEDDVGEWILICRMIEEQNY